MRHWTEDELIESIYGIGPTDGHLELCAECRARREAMEQCRAEQRIEPALPPSVLAAQRRAVYARAEQPRPRRSWAGAVAASAAVAALAIALLVSPPGNHGTRTDTASAADAQLFAEAWAAVDVDEPRAAQPIHALFEEAP